MENEVVNNSNQLKEELISKILILLNGLTMGQAASVLTYTKDKLSSISIVNSHCIEKTGDKKETGSHILYDSINTDAYPATLTNNNTGEEVTLDTSITFKFGNTTFKTHPETIFDLLTNAADSNPNKRRVFVKFL